MSVKADMNRLIGVFERVRVNSIKLTACLWSMFVASCVTTCSDMPWTGVLTQATLSRFHSSLWRFSCRLIRICSLSAIFWTTPSTFGSSSITRWRHTAVLLHNTHNNKNVKKKQKKVSNCEQENPFLWFVWSPPCSWSVNDLQTLVTPHWKVYYNRNFFINRRL